jgi:hypothetical protein
LESIHVPTFLCRGWHQAPEQFLPLAPTDRGTIAHYFGGWNEAVLDL